MFTINAAHFTIQNFEIGINNHLSIVTSVKYFCRLLYHRMNFYHKIHTPSYQARNLQSTLSTFKHWTIEVAIFRFRFIFKEKKNWINCLIVWVWVRVRTPNIPHHRRTFQPNAALLQEKEKHIDWFIEFLSYILLSFTATGNISAV